MSKKIRQSQRIKETKATRRRTSPPEPVRLIDVCEKRGLSLEEVARLIRRPCISRTEAFRTASIISTYQQLGQVLGGRLECNGKNLDDIHKIIQEHEGQAK